MCRSGDVTHRLSPARGDTISLLTALIYQRCLETCADLSAGVRVRKDLRVTQRSTVTRVRALLKLLLWQVLHDLDLLSMTTKKAEIIYSDKKETITKKINNKNK